MDKMKKDFSSSVLDFGPVQFFLARHFGFCYGVQNAIEIAYRTIRENPGKKIYLLSEMIHNPHVNDDLRKRGVEFMMDTKGNSLIPLEVLQPGDIVVVPAFGTTLETETFLKDRGVDVAKYNTTCPFVQKVWNRSASLAQKNYTIIIHGKPDHEETRATFSHSATGGPSLIIRNLEEARELGNFIDGTNHPDSFYIRFAGRYSDGFDVNTDLDRIGVVNQTTMLASETQQIADYLKKIMIEKYNPDEKNINQHFADTRDTLCYATNENQDSVNDLVTHEADLSLVIGGYNSSNTSHLVELSEPKLPTYFIYSANEIISPNEIVHFNLHEKKLERTQNFLPETLPVKILITSGASCPDAIVEEVINKIVSYFPGSRKNSAVLALFEKSLSRQ